MCKEKIERVSELFAALGVRQTNLYEDISIVGREEMFKYFPEL